MSTGELRSSGSQPGRLCGTWEGKSGLVWWESRTWREGHGMRRGRQARMQQALEGKAALEIASAPSCSRKQPAIKQELFTFCACFCQAPAVLRQLLRGRGDGSRDRAPLARTARGLGLAAGKGGKAAKFLSWASPTHIQT